MSFPELKRAKTWASGDDDGDVLKVMIQDLEDERESLRVWAQALAKKMVEGDDGLKFALKHPEDMESAYASYYGDFKSDHMSSFYVWKELLRVGGKQ
jgi:hypothetical protein